MEISRDVVTKASDPTRTISDDCGAPDDVLLSAAIEGQHIITPARVKLLMRLHSPCECFKPSGQSNSVRINPNNRIDYGSGRLKFNILNYMNVPGKRTDMVEALSSRCLRKTRSNPYLELPAAPAPQN